MKTILTCISLCLSMVLPISAQHNASWGQPPNGWDDFYLGLVNDYKNLNTVNETGYWLDVINKANNLSTYPSADPIKKSVLYQYKYINAGVDTATNWNSQKSLPPFGMNLLPGMRYDADQVGMRCAWVIYMMQEDAGAVAIKNNINNAVWLKNYFLNIKYVAETGAGRKEIFILEPDGFGYIIEKLWYGGVASTNMASGLSPDGVGLSMPAAMSTVAADPNYSYLAGLPNDFRGVVQGIIKTIRKYNPQAYCGVTANLWGAWAPSVINTPIPTKAGLVWWSKAQIDAAADYQSAFYQNLLNLPTYDKGDFLIPEKNGFPAYLAAGGQTNWMWGDQEMENYLYFFEKLGKAVCLPLVAWQVSLGQSNRAATFGITLTNPPATPFVPVPNSSQSYEDTYVQYMFNNFTKFIDAGFIGFLGGRGMPTGTEYALQSGYGDKGFFFNGAKTVIDPGRPWNLNRGVALPNLGADTTLCGTGGTIVLNPGNMGAEPVLWSTGATSPTISISTAGTYWVRVGNALSCPRTDTIKVSNTFSVDLGLDKNLCAAGSLLLDAGHSGTNVTYVWKKDGVLLPLDMAKTLLVSTPGVYRVEVTDPSCPPMKFDNITITTSALTTNSGVCVAMPGTATLTTSNTGGTYRWYANATGGVSLATGNSYTTPSLSAETTYYVVDEALYNTTIIPKTASNGFTNSPTNGNPLSTTDADWLYFDVLKDVQLVSLNMEVILYFSGGTKSVTLQISNPSTGFSYSQAITYTTPLISAGPTITAANLILPSALSLPAGTGYRIRLEAVEAFVYYKGNINQTVHPKIHSDLIRTTSYGCALGCAVAGMPALYNWVVKAASTCVRTPVLVRNCAPLPVDFIWIKAHKEANHDLISWKTAQNFNPSEYAVEYSTDGEQFVPLINEIIYKNNEFQANILRPQLGKIYYRIRHIDQSGIATLSKEVSIVHEALAYQIFPNPFQNHLKCTLLAPEGESGLYLLSDLSGRTIESGVLFASQPINIGQSLTKGLYIMQLISHETIEQVKIIKE